MPSQPSRQASRNTISPSSPKHSLKTILTCEPFNRHLLGLINDVLDLSKIEAGQLVLELSDYSIQDIAQTVRSTLEPLAADKKLGFKVEVAPQLPSGHGDGRRLTQVLITSGSSRSPAKARHSLSRFR
jgi:signal transduction histidine kinase